MELNIIFSKPYVEVRQLCIDLKLNNYNPKIVLQDFLQEISESVPPKSVLIPIPQSSGLAEYTENIALTIATYINSLGLDKTSVLFDCIKGDVRDSVCGRKERGAPFDDIHFRFHVLEQLKERLKNYYKSGWKLILVDDIVDTGTTIRAAGEALIPLGIELQDVAVLTLGDTGAWKNF